MEIYFPQIINDRKKQKIERGKEGREVLDRNKEDWEH